MRYEKGRKDVTRKRILEAASRVFREDGVAAVGLTTIMNDVQLTNGAFYAHFDSRDHLVRDALDTALQQQEAAMLDASEGHDAASAETAVRAYLSEAHRDNPGFGCPSAALLAEIARSPNETRKMYQDSLLRIVDFIERYVQGDAEASRRNATAIFSLMIGTLQMARAVVEPELSKDILEAGVGAALSLCGPASR